MFTLKFRDSRMSESVYGSVQHTSWHEGVLTANMKDGTSVTFGPNMGSDDGNSAIPIAFVMNEAGATVAKYEFFPMSKYERDAFLKKAEDALAKKDDVVA